MSVTTITRRYRFEAAHFLPNVPEGHKCKRMHGHNYCIEVELSGPVGTSSGFICDFFDLDLSVAPMVKECDHRVLNDVLGLENPTAELIGQWFLNGIRDRLRFAGALFDVRSVRVFETDDCWATVY